MTRRRPFVVGESYVQKEVIKVAEKFGWMCRKVVYQNRIGAPDIWCFAPGGRLIIIEFKRPGGKAKPHQEREIERLINLGFDVHVIDTIEKGRVLFDDLI